MSVAGGSARCLWCGPPALSPPPPIHALVCLHARLACRADTLRLLERHLVVFSGGYNASGIANLLEVCGWGREGGMGRALAVAVAPALSSLPAPSPRTAVLQCYCTHRLQLGQPAAEAVCERVLAILQQPQPQPGQTAFSFGALARVLAAVAALPLHLPRLLPPLLHALRCALAAPERLLDPSGCLPPRFSEHLIFAMVALGQLQAGGLLAPAGLASAEAVLPLWRLLVDWASVAADGAGAGAAGHAVSPDSARRVQWAAMQLNQGLAGGQAAFQLPPAVLRVLGPPAARWGVQEQQQYM